MEKNIRDYIHLYLGCEAMVEIVDQEGYQWSKPIKVVLDNYSLYEISRGVWRNPKPLLRPLDTMTEEELKGLATICYKEVFDHEPEFNEVEMVLDKYGGGLKFTEDNGKWNYGLTVSDCGVMFSANGNFLNVSPFTTTLFLLSKHFDIFNLLTEGLAIDATNHTQKSHHGK